jgi:RNA polymerase primary sigma factor
MLSREEERDLFLELQDKGLSAKKREQIKTTIIKANLRFIFKQAKYFSKNDPDLFAELIAAGNEGLLVGLEKYDPMSGNRFLSYAGHWVNQRILKEMSKMRIVSLPIWRQQQSQQILKFMENKEVTPTFEELKKQFPKISEKDLKELSSTRYLTYYLEDMTDDPAFEIDPIGNDVETRMDRDRLHTMIKGLPSPHQEIIELSYGIRDGEETTHANIAKQLGISKDQLREYKREALEMLKDKLQNY